MPSRRTPRVSAMAPQLNDFWQPRTHSPRLIAHISCLQMHPLHPLLPTLWYHHWGLGFLHQACLLLALSHPQCRLLEPSHLEYLQPCPPPMPPGAGGHGPPSAGTPGAGHPGHGHSHPHPFPPGGMPHPGMSQMQLAHHGPHGLGHPHAGPPGSGGQPPPRPPPGMPHPGPPPMGMPPRGPPFGSPMGHPGPMPPHGMRGPPPLMPPHGYTGPPRPPPYGYQRGPFLHPDPLPGLLFPLEAHFGALFLNKLQFSFLLFSADVFSIPWTNQSCCS